MSKLHHTGDVLLDKKINMLCEYINQIEAAEFKKLPDFLEDHLTLIEKRKIRLVRKTISKSNCRNFPQFDTQNGIIAVWYFISKDNPPVSQQETILMQLSIAAVLVFCGPLYVDELPADISILSFCRKWPEYANHATYLYNLLGQKFK